MLEYFIFKQKTAYEMRISDLSSDVCSSDLDVTKIVGSCPGTRQTLLFSATYADDIRKASARFLHKPKEIKVESVHGASQIEKPFNKIEVDGLHKYGETSGRKEVFQ